MRHFFPTPEKGRQTIYISLFILLLGGRALLGQLSQPISLQHYIFVEFAAALLAIFVGTLALVRFYTKKNNTFLFIGTGFLGAGLLDSYHVTTLWSLLNGLTPLPQLAWNWDISRTFLAVLMLVSWLHWRQVAKDRQPEPVRHGHIRLYLVAATFITLILFWPLSPLPAAAILDLGRVEIIVSAIFFAWALVGYIDKKIWIENPFDHWLIFSLIFSYVGQALFLFSSRDHFDPFFAAAHWLKLFSYLSVLIGLLISMYAIFKQAEQDGRQLGNANVTLQQEIKERLRAEQAEQEQRQLAEALREVGNALSATLDYNQLLDRLLDQIAYVLPYHTANVMLLEGDRVHIVCTRGYTSQFPERLTRFSLKDMPTLQQMLLTKQPYVIPDTATHPTWVQAEASPHVRSWAGSPIMAQQEVVAFLALNHQQPDFYQPVAAARLIAFAGQASIAIQNARLYEALQKRVEELITLNEISQLVTSTLDLQTTLRQVTEHTIKLLGVAATSVVLYDQEQGDLWFAAASGEASDHVLGKRLALGQGILGWVAQHGQPVFVPDVRQDSRHFDAFDQKSGFVANSIVSVPLLAQQKIIGAIEALNKKDGPFVEEDLRLLTWLASPAAAAIENARLYEQAQQEIKERKRVEADLSAERALLTQRVEERTADLQATNAELERAMHLKDEFLASMSHELRTPLNTILGMSDALQEQVYGPLGEKQLRALQRIEQSGRHLLDLINDILDLAKVEAGKLELVLEPTAVESVCQDSLNFIRREAEKKRLRIHFRRDEAVTIIQADERRLKQILVNLLNNAVKFTLEEGEIGLEVQGDAAAHTVAFTVWDTGIGIAEDDMERLFHPFIQLDSRLSRQYTGTGLGLSLASQFTQKHGGTISAESNLGQGSRFTVTLPWVATRLVRQPPQNTPSLQPLPQNRPTTILIVEDNEAIMSALDEYLTIKGYNTITASNGYMAVEQTLTVQPDLVLMDIQMPELDGLEAIRRIRAAQNGDQAIPIIALTALAMPGDEERCLQAGANAYLTKPVRLAELIQMIESVIRH